MLHTQAVKLKAMLSCQMHQQVHRGRSSSLARVSNLVPIACTKESLETPQAPVHYIP